MTVGLSIPDKLCDMSIRVRCAYNNNLRYGRGVKVVPVVVVAIPIVQACEQSRVTPDKLGRSQRDFVEVYGLAGDMIPSFVMALSSERSSIIALTWRSLALASYDRNSMKPLLVNAIIHLVQLEL